MKILKAHGEVTVIKELYLDLDGVFADFERGVRERLGYNPKDVEDDTLWADVVAWDQKHKYGWFASLQPMPDAFELWEHVKDYHPRFLTATGKSVKNASTQKERWVRKHICKTTEILFVESGKHKAEYAHKHALLIDDRSASCDPWRKAGGIAIKHKSAVETIRQLSSMRIL